MQLHPSIPSTMAPHELIFQFLTSRLSVEALSWLGKSFSKLEEVGKADDTHLFFLFSTAIRHCGKNKLNLNPQELDAAATLLPGWNPSDWTLDQSGRILLLLALPPTVKSARLMDAIYQTADLGEALALMKALPLLANPLEHLARAREGARSNVKTQFEAVALRNPYPALHFDEMAWNQLVSKAIFVESPLEEIVGLDERANPTLNQILMDLVKERQAANRAFNPQLYRCLGPCANEIELDLLEKILAMGSEDEQKATLIGLKFNSSPRSIALKKTKVKP